MVASSPSPARCCSARWWSQPPTPASSERLLSAPAHRPSRARAHSQASVTRAVGCARPGRPSPSARHSGRGTALRRGDSAGVLSVSNDATSDVSLVVLRCPHSTKGMLRGQRQRIPIANSMRELRRALDIRAEKRDCPLREGVPAGRLCSRAAHSTASCTLALSCLISQSCRVLRPPTRPSTAPWPVCRFGSRLVARILSSGAASSSAVTTGADASRGEVAYRVPVLAEPEAVALFCARARIEPSDDVSDRAGPPPGGSRRLPP
jgi:hypothetical protein